MRLSPGSRLGPYEVVGPLGAGGMGEVYRARDTRLGRAVAIKILPHQLASSPEDRARFRREAKAISSLNHPHICTLHDIGQEGDTDYLVLELVEGETLAHRIARGPLPTADVLRIGAQVADALERAHRAGVVHRDLKPGNVMLTKSGAKLMDFGLAREVRPPARGRDETVTEPGSEPESEESITKRGMIVGTFQYMAPEQLEGRRADARTDIWALGCVLYEMATGKRAFQGSTPVSVISAIMKDEPRRMTELAPLTPPAFERLVRQCLAKDPEDRWQTASDLRRELKWIAEADTEQGRYHPVIRRRKLRERLSWALAGVAIIALTTVLTRPKRHSMSYVFELPPPPEVSTVDLPRISPDGKYLAFNATDSAGASAIWIRAMNSTDARRLPGTEGASRPFWSPDSRYLAFIAREKLQKVSINGGPLVTLCDAAVAGDGTWSRHGVILFDGRLTDDVQRVSSSGGASTTAVPRDTSRHESGSAWPQFLPDGKHFLFISYRESSETGTLKVGLIGSRKTVDLGPASSRAEFSSGRLLFVRGGTLVARPFDVRALKFVGEPVAIAENVESDRGGGARFSTGAEGTLVYHTGASPYAERLVWVDRRGNRIGTVGGLGNYDSAALSADGRYLAASAGDQLKENRGLRLWDLARGLESRLTFASEDVISPTWSPDGARIAFSMKNGSRYDLFTRAINRADGESLLYSSAEVKGPDDWSSDGQWLIYSASKPAEEDFDIYALSLRDPERPEPLVRTKFWDSYGALSPDSKWLAYGSREGDHWEVYVTPFRGSGDRWRISSNGGVRPAWREDGRELYYLASDGGMMSVAVEAGSTPHFSVPRKLFDSRIVVPFLIRTCYMPAPDGQRFLLVRNEGESRVGVTKVLLNWPEVLSK